MFFKVQYKNGLLRRQKPKRDSTTYIRERESNSIRDHAQQCHFSPRREKEVLSTNLCQGRIKMACNSSPLTATDLEIICFAVRI